MKLAVIVANRPFRSKPAMEQLVALGVSVIERPLDDDTVSTMQELRPSMVLLAVDPRQLADRDVIRAMREAVPQGYLVIVTPAAVDYRFATGLDAGGDVCIDEADPETLNAQLRAVCRRLDSGAEGVPLTESRGNVIALEGVEVNSRMFSVTYKNQLIPFTPMEFRIFKTLATNTDRVLAASEIISEASGYAVSNKSASESLKVYIRRMRTKIEQVTDAVDILSVRGFGYVLTVRPVTTAEAEVAR